MKRRYYGTLGESTTRHHRKKKAHFSPRSSVSSLATRRSVLESRAEQSRGKPVMPSVASFMMPAGKAVTACPEDKLRSVVDSLVNEKIGCVVVVDAGKAVGIITKQDVNRFFLSEVRTQPPRPRLPSLSSLNPTQPRKPRRETTRYTPRYAPIRPRNPIPTNKQPLTVRVYHETAKSSRKSFFSFSPPAPPRRRSHWTLP